MLTLLHIVYVVFDGEVHVSLGKISFQIKIASFEVCLCRFGYSQGGTDDESKSKVRELFLEQEQVSVTDQTITFKVLIRFMLKKWMRISKSEGHVLSKEHVRK